MLKLDHVVFPVRDAEKTLAFYRDVLRLPLVATHTGDDWDGYPWLMMIFGLGGGQELVCVALQGAPTPDYRGVPVDARHYAFSAEGEADIDLWRSRLSQHAVEFWEEHHGDQRSVYFADPDGVVLEVTWPATRAMAVERLDALAAALSWIAKAKQPA
jgi:catechol 2,3-dioxygenase-like lactoylglutathione lyase family enzyme